MRYFVEGRAELIHRVGKKIERGEQVEIAEEKSIYILSVNQGMKDQ